MSRIVRGGVDDLRKMARGWRWGRRPLVPRSAEPFLVPAEQAVFPTEWARRPAARAIRGAVQTAGLTPLFTTQVAPQVEGRDVLTRVQPPVLFVANHASHLDTPLILCSLPQEWRRNTAVAAAADYFFDTWWRAVGSALVFNTFPIERRGGTLSATPGELLRQGWNVVVFPEGTRSVDGWVGPFRGGAARLSIEHHVPVVPVAHRGTFAAMPRGQGWPSRGRRPVRLRFGEPVRPQAGESAQALSARIRDAIGALLDEETSTWWEARRRLADGTTPDPAGPQVAQWRRVWAQSQSPRVDVRQRAWR